MHRKRSEYSKKLINQITSMHEKSVLLRDVSYKILNEEIPKNQRLYIEKKLEPVIQEQELILLNEREKYKLKFAKNSVRRFKDEIARNESLKSVFESQAKDLSNKVIS